jgi:hypothetical protein
MDTFRAAAKRPCCANEAAEAKATNSAKANFTGVDMGNSIDRQIRMKPIQVRNPPTPLNFNFMTHSGKAAAMKRRFSASLFYLFRRIWS